MKKKYSLSYSARSIVCASCHIIFIVESQVWYVLGALYVFFVSPLENRKAVIVNGGPLSIIIGILSSITVVVFEAHL